MPEEKTVQDELNDIEVDDHNDDLFEKVLNDDTEIPSDEDAGTGDSDKQTEDVTKENEDDESDEVKALKDEIAQLRKEAKGRLNDVVKSRQEKRQFQSELDQLKGAVTTLLEKKDTTTNESGNDDGETSILDDVVKVEFGEDDKAYVDLKNVKKAISAETEKTRSELEELRMQDEMRQAQDSYKKNVQSIISEKQDIFEPAYDKLKDTYKDLNDSIIELQKRTGERGNADGTLSIDHALDLFSGSPEEEAFAKAHPGIDPTRVARAFNSKIDLRTSLKHLVDVLEIGKKEEGDKTVLDDRIKKAQDKPGTLGGHENRETITSDLIERVSQLNWEDMEKMSDAEAAKIEQLLLQQELKGD